MKLGNKMVLALVCAIGLGGCSPGGVEVHREDREFVVTDVKPPKRMDISLRDVKTGAQYNRLSVSKRCSNWEGLKVGSKWELPEVTYQHDDGSRTKRVEIYRIKNKFC